MQGRIQKILSAHGVASRRASEQLILQGRVTVNGNVATIGGSADDECDDIRIDGTALAPAGKPVYLMLNKPAGYLTTVSDDRGRMSVLQLVSDAGARVYPVGRLDMDSEGLLLMTNDGQFANSVMHPSFNIAKTYEVCVRGDIDGGLVSLKRHVTIDEYTVHAVSAAIKERSGARAVISIQIAEGRNRQIRKMCAVCGLYVESLKRVAIGPLELGSLETGKWRFLTRDEVDMMLPQLG